MTLAQARELSRLSNETFYVLINDAVSGDPAVYQCWPGGRCVQYAEANMGSRFFQRYKLRAKECEKRVLVLQQKYERHLQDLGE